MKPFDLEKALAGDPVVTRDGRDVYEATLFSVSRYPLRAVIDDDDVKSFTKDGRSFYSEGDSNHDLFMAPKKRTVWVNFYAQMATGSNRGFFYDTEELANNAASAGRIGNKAYQIEIEE